jgi:hypothetical protein
MANKTQSKKKKVSKGNVFDFIEDANKDPKLYKQMIAIIKTKGKGYTAETLLKKFHRLGYEGVSLQATKRIMATLKRLKDPEAWDWHY